AAVATVSGIPLSSYRRTTPCGHTGERSPATAGIRRKRGSVSSRAPSSSRGPRRLWRTKESKDVHLGGALQWGSAAVTTPGAPISPATPYMPHEVPVETLTGFHKCHVRAPADILRRHERRGRYRCRDVGGEGDRGRRGRSGARAPGGRISAVHAPPGVVGAEPRGLVAGDR